LILPQISNIATINITVFDQPTFTGISLLMGRSFYALSGYVRTRLLRSDDHGSEHRIDRRQWKLNTSLSKVINVTEWSALRTIANNQRPQVHFFEAAYITEHFALNHIRIERI
jgi:hypothetical protein